jgi:hypothetical protein
MERENCKFAMFAKNLTELISLFVNVVHMRRERRTMQKISASNKVPVSAVGIFLCYGSPCPSKNVGLWRQLWVCFIIVLTINVLVVCLARDVCNAFDVGTIHYKGHWKGCPLKLKTFLGSETANSETSAV